mgnify:CR=1 FL=1|jgi:hypothetical protein
MLLPDNIHPENTLLYNGALIIRALRNMGDANLLDLYVEARRDSSLSMPLFVLSLDWLYLANCVEITEEGTLALCS